MNISRFKSAFVVFGATVVLSLVLFELAPQGMPELHSSTRSAVQDDTEADDRVPFALHVTFGHTDSEALDWDGSVEIEAGSLTELQEWKFLEEDALLSSNTWRLRSKRDRRRDRAIGERIHNMQQLPGPPPPSGIFIVGQGTESTSIQLDTKQGKVSFRLAEAGWGKTLRKLSGAIEIERVPGADRVSQAKQANDFPSIAVGSGGKAWAVWQSYAGGRDEVQLAGYKEGEWYTHTTLPGSSGDVWRPQVVVDKQNDPWVIWSQQVEGDWDLYGLGYHTNWIDSPVKLTHRPGPDINARAVCDDDGRIYVVWQGVHGAYSQIYLMHFFDGQWSDALLVSPAHPTGNAWNPVIAAGSGGRVHIAWDTYRNGNYDVYLRSFDPSSGLGPEVEVARSARYEAYPSVACDRQGRVWAAWESGPVLWGKDLGFLLPDSGPGAALGDPMEIRIAVFEDGRRRMPAADPQLAFPPNDRDRSRYPELAIDGHNRLWLLFRHSISQSRHFWTGHVTSLTSDGWTRPVALPSSTGRISSLAQIASLPDGGAMAVWHTDTRTYARSVEPHDNHIFAGIVDAPAADTVTLAEPRDDSISAPVVHANEKVDVARIRSYRAKVTGKTYQIVRGDLHRHAELSWDLGGGRDGSVFDFYRYMIDAGAMDFGGLTEHQEGGGEEYWYWYNQKAADLFNWPAFRALFSYERSERYPYGHRNIVHARRGIPVVGFFTRPETQGLRPTVGARKQQLVENDVKLLYDELRKTSGIAISHTSGTEMGTDWSDNDPVLEPVVELYQGCRTLLRV